LIIFILKRGPMKNIFLLSLFIVFSVNIDGQITLDHSYAGSNNMSLDKLSTSGYKYVKTDIPNHKVELYNTNHTLFKAITIPATTLPLEEVQYVSEGLFDTDNMIEFAVIASNGGHASFSVFKENGTLIFFRDSAYNGQAAQGYATKSNNFNNYENVFFDGLNTKLRLTIHGLNLSILAKNEIYALPGSIPCIECGSDTTIVAGIFSPGNQGFNNPIFYPNPVADQLKLRYTLPKNYKIAEIKIHDIEGKLLQEFKVTDTFDFIYLTSNYNNGMYFYTLLVDEKTIKTEKIVLNK
jgi:hypothetical protein